MARGVLVTFATRYGSTAEVAYAVGEIISEEGAVVEVLPIADVGTVKGFDAVVLGCPARLGRLLPEAVNFMKRQAPELTRVPVAYFLTGMTMRDDTPENRRQAASYLNPLRKIREPLRTGLFGGKVDRTRLGALLRFFLAHDRKETLAEGDYRDWPEIRRWARELAVALNAGTK